MTTRRNTTVISLTDEKDKREILELFKQGDCFAGTTLLDIYLRRKNRLEDMKYVRAVRRLGMRELADYVPSCLMLMIG